jgi:hypothetical protein
MVRLVPAEVSLLPPMMAKSHESVSSSNPPFRGRPGGVGVDDVVVDVCEKFRIFHLIVSRGFSYS